MKKPLFQELATLVDARLRCRENGNTEWETLHTEKIKELCERYLPSGSGYDLGTQLELLESDGEKLVFLTQYHHMDDHGSYVKWTQHKVTVRPSLIHSFTLKIGGPDYRGIKEMMYDNFNCDLAQDVE